MDIVSPPAYLDETVVDIDFGTTTGTYPVTLHVGDVLTDEGPYLEVAFASPPRILTFYKAHLVWKGKQTRVVRTPLKAATPSTAIAD
jgi:hypothetical protein